MTSPSDMTSLGEILTFEQKFGESFKNSWKRISERYKKMQPRIEFSVLLKIFYFGFTSVYQHALDDMVGETFSEYDAIKAFRIVNGLAIFPMMDKTDKVIERLDKMEKTLNDLAMNEKESTSEVKQPLDIMKNDW